MKIREIKYWAVQVPPENQEDDLFYRTKTGEMGMEDDYYTGNVILTGNNNFLSVKTDAYRKLEDYIDDAFSSYSDLKEAWSNFDDIGQIVDYYFGWPKEHYSAEEVAEWEKILLAYRGVLEEDIVEKALFLMTGKKWKSVSIRGCCQGDWQEGYINSEKISDNALDYIEACYFNTGEEYKIYESKEDFDAKENCFHIYVVNKTGDQSKAVADYFGCKPEEIALYEFDGWERSPKYKLAD